MKLLAKALYDNEAESDEELDFKVNDILEVLNKQQEGLEGWWLCKLNNRTGLAPGNRLKLIVDQEGSDKSNNFNYSKNTRQTSLNNLPMKKVDFSSTSTTFITKSVDNILKNYHNQNTPSNTTSTSLSVDLSHDDDDNDQIEANDDYDYEYDIPLNNNELTNNQAQKRAHFQQLISKKQFIKVTREDTSSSMRKSNSPTIDSGISTSIFSLNESTLSTTESAQNEAKLRNLMKNIRDTSSTLLNIQKLHKDWRKRSCLENSIQIIKCNCNELKIQLHELFNFIKINYKFKLVSSLKLREYQLQLHKFINFYDSNILILNSHQWNLDLLQSNEILTKSLSVNDELNEILMRLNYLNDLNRLIYDLITQNSQRISIQKDDCDEKIYENDDYEWLSKDLTSKNAQRHVLVTYPEDKILIRFYFKIIDENLNEMHTSYTHLNKLNANKQKIDQDLAHKLALNGHKLVFMCDTLNRNLKNKLLKYNLEEISNNLCDNLKLYIIRMKMMTSTTTLTSSDSILQLINESLLQIYNNSNKLRQLLNSYLL